MGLTPEKWGVMGMLAVISVFLGFVPYFMIRWSKNSRFLRPESTLYKLVLTILSCFGAGVLLSTAALHLLRDVRENLAEIPSVWETLDTDFPLAEVIALAGFALIYLVEEVAHFIMVDGHHSHHHHNPNSIARHNSIAHGIHLPEETCGGGDGGLESGGTLTIPHSHPHHHHHHHEVTLKMQSGDSSHQEEECPDEQNSLASSMRAMLTLIALSFHELMEGVAIGIQEESDMWVMFGAVASHKFVISFCMGMELMNSQASFRTFAGSILFFGVVTSLGIGIGGAVTTSNANTLPVAVIEGLVVGTLLYVVCFEILNRERDRKTYAMNKARAIGFVQFFALASGMVAMGALTLLTHKHDHAHSEDGHDGHDDHTHLY